ncbi:alpha/beta fold hydrolase [Allosaccharopolyspora coralli]|uniref:Alpha/beta fold hydrolase n=1 Tax=Allosaccharopolyspora coralli TaxID=2665642 RepID=A0A5Q3Q9I1_9PSEU|nr:alpha/beta fold hydrolase [Allosaccharopolyspora coralli]QGK70510.1 alpha/beta fold hydrolase [Allosaccharopolyspora coralli]
MRAGESAGTREVTLHGARVRVRSGGDPEAPPVVLLHGIGRSLEDWAPQYPLLATDHYVIAPDLPGFGLSEPTPGPTTLESLADDVLALVDSIGETRPVHVAGNSLGGAVAMRVAAMAPERVSSLLLANSVGFGRDVTIALRVLGIPMLGARLLRRTDPATVRRTERALFRSREFVTQERLAHATEVARQPHRARVFVELARRLGTVRGIRPAWRAQLLADFARDPKPTLAVWGDADLVLPARHLEAVPDRIPHARTHLFTGAGHMPQIERAAEFADLARDHFSR